MGGFRFAFEDEGNVAGGNDAVVDGFSVTSAGDEFPNSGATP